MEFGKTASELRVGDRATLVHTVAESDLALFAGATGDMNPIHFDQVYAEQTFFKGRIAHGILSAGFISAVIANRLPGLGTIYVNQNLKFLAPVRIGDDITTEVRVLEVNAEKNRVRLQTTCTNQEGTVVLDGEAVVMPPRRKPGAEESARLRARNESIRAGLDSAVAAFSLALAEAGAQAGGLGAAADLWADCCGQWVDLASRFQDRTDRLVNAWADQTLRAQSESQEWVQGWLENTSRQGLELWGRWHRSLERLMGLGQPRPTGH